MGQVPEQKKKFAPAPPEPEITIRTMESDVKSIEQSGGEVGVPEIFTPQAPQAPQAPKQQEKVRAGLNLPGYTGPEKSIFQSSVSVGSPQQQTNSTVENSGGKWKITAVIIGILIGIIVLILIGYYIIFPWLFPVQMPPVQ